jgi:hypothetical protein
LSPEQQRAIVAKMIVGAARANARRLGRPPPIILDLDGNPYPGSLGPEAIGKELPTPDPNHPAIEATAERIKTQLRLFGLLRDQPASTKKTA